MRLGFEDFQWTVPRRSDDLKSVVREAVIRRLENLAVRIEFAALTLKVGAFFVGGED
jgi:hypothetical protein